MPGKRLNPVSEPAGRSQENVKSRPTKKHRLTSNERERAEVLRRHLRKLLGGSALQTSGIEVDAHSVQDSIDNAEKTRFAEVQVSNMERINDEILQVLNALNRICLGMGNTCEDCETHIPVTRTKGIPYATRCVTCQTHYEAPGRQASRLSAAKQWNLEAADLMTGAEEKELTLDDVQ